jgi:hypothetical protein
MAKKFGIAAIVIAILLAVGFWPGAVISVHACYQSAVELKAAVQKA